MANCSITQTGLIPVADGIGMYPGGNDMPAAWRTIGQDYLDRIQKTDGHYKVGMFGFSNTRRYALTTGRNWRNYGKRHLRLYNLCHAAYDTRRMAEYNLSDPLNFWALNRQILSTAGVNRADIRIGILQIALSKPGNMGVPLYIAQLTDLAAQVTGIIAQEYPGIEQLWVLGREYAGYATSPTNPEPYAHATEEAVKTLVQDQIDHGLPTGGPWLAWGPPPWADGLLGRQYDGLTWPCNAFVNDGTHPSLIGRDIFYGLLDSFLATEPLARKWYLNL